MTQAFADPVSSALKSLMEVSKTPPEAAVILGSGVNVLETVGDTMVVSYKDVFGIAPGIAGHAGSITLGSLNGRSVAVLRGRFHLYEGHAWNIVSLAAQTLCEWGVSRLFVTNAAGGINSSFQVGDLMVLTSYLDFLNPKHRETGLLPALRAGKTDCANTLTQVVLDTGSQLAQVDRAFRPLRAGTYAGLLGPTYETLSEIEMLRQLGADAVGMSTVPELEMAHAKGIPVAAISVITNVWNPEELIGGHEEVLHAAKEASERLDKLLQAVIIGQ